MSMRGELISVEYQKMVWVRDDKGGEYVCYAKDLESPDHVSDAEKAHCLDTSLVMGPSWGLLQRTKGPLEAVSGPLGSLGGVLGPNFHVES